MSEYTPDEDAVRRAYRYRALNLWDDDGTFRDAEFDRFIACVKAEAWDEGMEAGQRAIILKEYTPDNPYRKDEK